MWSSFLTTLALFYFSSTTISAQRIPENPCPNLFSYHRDQNGFYFGEVQVPNDGSKQFTLAVNVSMIGYYNNLRLTLKLLTPSESILNSRYLRYRLDFPLQNVLPRLTQILFNGNIHCYGPSETLGQEGITDLWASLVYTIRTSQSQQLQPVEFFVEPTTHRPANQNAFPNQPTNPPQRPHIQRPPQSPPIDSTPNQIQPQPPPLDLSPNPVQFQRPAAAQTNQCGIVNEPTGQHEFPWLVATFHRQGVSYIFRCTANLISNKHVLTAGHCVQYYNAPLVPKSDILLVLGQSDLSNWALSGATLRSVSEVKVHPNYMQDSGHCDIAVLTMDKSVTFTANIAPICFGDIALNEDGTVAGWGKDESGQETVPKPTKVIMPMVSQDVCLKSNLGFQNLTSDKTFCAGNRDGNGPCTGESGAGFVVKIGKRWYLRGMVSTAIKINNGFACDLDEYVVFSDVSKLQDWIRNAMT